MDLTENLKPNHIDCRFLHHAWQWLDVKEDRRRRLYRQSMLCSRCGTEKFYEISFQGEIVTHPRYSYADGYLIKGGGGVSAEDRALIRVAAIRHHLTPTPQKKGSRKRKAS